MTFLSLLLLVLSFTLSANAETPCKAAKRALFFLASLAILYYTGDPI